MQIWLKFANQFMRYGAHKQFCLEFGSLSPAVTLKIRSMSPKPNQLFIMSQFYIHANLVKRYTRKKIKREGSSLGITVLHHSPQPRDAKQ